MYCDHNNLGKINGQIVCEKPNNAIYKFEGYIETSGQKISLSADNVILRGCSVKNTDFVVGLVVFTGHDTKVMQNSCQAKYKFSKLEKLTNKSILIILGVQIILSFIAGVVGQIWLHNNKNKDNSNDYLALNDINVNKGGGVILQMGTWILIFTNLVPISLMVSLEMVKFWQAMFMT